MSRTLGVSRSGFYAFHSRPPGPRIVEDAALTARIETIHEASKQTYGAPRIHAELCDEGVFVGRKRPSQACRHALPGKGRAIDESQRLEGRQPPQVGCQDGT